MAGIKINNLWKQYGPVKVVHGINFDIKPNEFIVLVGPSGCGKSTTLRMIAGLEEITDGEISIGDRVVNDMAPKDRNVAMVFQNYALYPHMNIFENMAFGLKMQKVPKPEIEKRVHEAAKILDIGSYLERKPAQLSGGQRQRVAMGRAIVRNPDVFLFDEPLSNLDAKLRNQMRIEIKKLHAKLSTTIVYVTHDQVEAMTLADRIVVMKDGFIEQIGEPLEIYNHPANTFVAGFIGSPPMNMLQAKVKKEGQKTTLDFGDGKELPLPENKSLADRSEVLVGIRPEHLLVNPETSDKVWEFKSTLNVLETLGHETLLHTEVGESKLIAKDDSKALTCKEGETISFGFELNQIHLFDVSSGKAILE